MPKKEAANDLCVYELLKEAGLPVTKYDPFSPYTQKRK